MKYSSNAYQHRRCEKWTISAISIEKFDLIKQNFILGRGNYPEH